MDGCERRKRDYVRARDETRGDGTGDAFRLYGVRLIRFSPPLQLYKSAQVQAAAKQACKG